MPLNETHCPSYRSQGQSRPSVAVLLAGSPSHRHVGKVDYVAQFASVFVYPLVAGGMEVGLFATGSNEVDVVEWRRFFQPLGSVVSAVDVMRSHDIVDRRRTRFSDAACLHKHMKGSSMCVDMYLQWSHLDATFQLVRKREALALRPFDYLVKARNDFVFRPGDVLRPEWLLGLPTDVLAFPSVEFHQRDRWLERVPGGGQGATWPGVINDQIVFGPRSSMGTYLDLLRAGPPYAPKSVRIEPLIAHHVRHAREPPLRVVTVELQYAHPGAAKHVNGRGGQWVSSRCLYCWQPLQGRAVTGGVGDSLGPVPPCASDFVAPSPDASAGGSTVILGAGNWTGEPRGPQDATSPMLKRLSSRMPATTAQPQPLHAHAHAHPTHSAHSAHSHSHAQKHTLALPRGQNQKRSAATPTPALYRHSAASALRTSHNHKRGKRALRR